MSSNASTTISADTERVVSLPVLNPDTGGRSKSFRFMGRVDEIQRDKIIDVKSCSDPARFIQTLAIGLQPELYALACEHHGYPISEIEYRLLKKPGIKFCGKDKDDDGNLDVALYEKRCFDWMLEKPANMVTHNLTLSKARLEQASAYLWDCSKRILENRKADRWIANEGACFDWNRECSYMPLCLAVSQGADHNWVIEQQYKRLDDAHPELDGASDGLSVLTYSSMKALARCEMIYYWEHEHRLHKSGEFSEALWVGSAIHCGVDAFKSGGLGSARAAISDWDEQNPTLGPDATHLARQNVAKAVAMVRAADMKWN